jgi:type I restriction enzyme S subunit
MSGTPFTTLGQVATTVRNGLFAKRPTDDSSGTPILRISAVREGRVSLSDLRYVASLTPHDVEKFSLRENDLLLTRYNGSRHLVGISGLVPPHPGPLIHPDKLIRVQLDSAVADCRFVNLQLASPQVRNFLEPRIRTTAGQSGIAGGDVRAIPLWLPPVPEQRRIVEILEDHLSRLDVTAQTLAQLPQRLSALRLSLIAGERRRLLDRGTSSRRIGDVCETSLGKMLDAKRAVGTPTPYLRNINVRWGEIDQADVLTVPLTEEERSRYALERGDVMVCEGGEPGRCAIWQGSGELMTFQKALHRLRPRDGSTRPAFVAAMLEELVRSGRADLWFTGTTIRHLPQEKLRMLEIPLPSRGEQDKFLARLDALTGDIARFTAANAVARERASALRQSLLESAFSAQLTRHCPDPPVGRPREVLDV